MECNANVMQCNAMQCNAMYVCICPPVMKRGNGKIPEIKIEAEKCGKIIYTWWICPWPRLITGGYVLYNVYACGLHTVPPIAWQFHVCIPVLKSIYWYLFTYLKRRICINFLRHNPTIPVECVFSNKSDLRKTNTPHPIPNVSAVP